MIIAIYSSNNIFLQLLEMKIYEVYKIDIILKRKIKEIDQKNEKKTFDILILDINSKKELSDAEMYLKRIKCEEENIKKIIVIGDFELKENCMFVEKLNMEFLSHKDDLVTLLKSIINVQEEKEQDIYKLKITKRELEILKLIAKGLLNKEIADELNITERTVKNHISNLFKKINVYDRTQAAVFAIKNNIHYI